MDGLQQRCKFFAQATGALCGYAEWRFRSDRKIGSAGTEGEHEDAAAVVFASLGIARPVSVTSDAPPFPEEIAHVWDWFQEITWGLAPGGMGPQLVTWESIDAWRRLALVEVEPWESAALVRLGCLRASILSEDDAKPKDKS